MRVGSFGNRNYVWLDVNPGGELGPGDTFTVTYISSPDGCWYNDFSGNIDALVI
jgi:hypothetical protein